MPENTPSLQEQPSETPTEAPISTEPATDDVMEARLAQLAEQQRTYDEAINQVRTLMTYQTQAQMPQPKPLDPDKILTDPTGYQSDLLGNIAGAMQAVMGQDRASTFDALSVSAKHLSRGDPKVSSVWDKYGTEIEALGSSGAIDPRLRGSKEFWDKAAKVVQAEHLDDVIQERAQALAAELRSGGVEPGSGSYGASDPADSSVMDKLRESPYGKTLLEKYGERGVLRNVEKLGVTLDKYADMVIDTNIVVNPSNPSEWHNRDLMRGR